MELDLTTLQRIAIGLAPELRASDLRVLMHQEDWPSMGEATSAYVLNGQPLHVRDYLKAEHTWRGKWPGVVVFVKEPTLGLLLHETAHLLPARAAELDTTSPATPEHYEMQLAAIAASNIEDIAPAVPWDGHGREFVRRVLHLRYRAKRAGLHVPLRELGVGGWCYGQNNIRCYHEVLGDEPERMLGATFAEIAATPEPVAFRDCFDESEAFYGGLMMRGERCLV